MTRHPATDDRTGRIISPAGRSWRGRGRSLRRHVDLQRVGSALCRR